MKILWANTWRNPSFVRKHIFPLFFLTIGICLIYSNSLHNSFQFDDIQIVERPNLHASRFDLESLKNAIYFTPEKRHIYRPIPNLTLAINYYFGRLDPFGYHLVNIAVHVLCSIMVYIFLYTLLSIPSIRPRFAMENRYEIAMIGAFLFAFHPIQTNVATYIIQRMASIEALFYIISVTAFIRFRFQTPQSGMTFRKCMSVAICMIAGLFAMLSKENAAFLPAMLLIIDFLFFYIPSSEPRRQRLKVIYGVVIFFILIIVAYKGPSYLGSFFAGYERRSFTLTERLLTESRIVFFYLFILIFPNVHLLALNHDIDVSTGLLTPSQTFFAVLGIAVLLICSYKFRAKFNLLSFAILWYFGNLVIESTIIPLELIFEHRTYVPGVSIFLCMAFLITYVLRKFLKKDISILFVSLMLVLYGNATYIRNAICRTEVSLWMDVVDKSPDYARGHANLGKAYLDKVQLEQAEIELKKAIKLDPAMLEPYGNLAKVYFKEGLNGKVMKTLREMQRARPASVWTLVMLGNGYFDLKRYGLAEHCYSRAIKMVPFWLPAINNLGIAQIKLGKTNQAIRTFQFGINADATYTDFYINLAKLYSNQEKYDRAIRVLGDYLAIDSKSRKAAWLVNVIKKKAERHEGKLGKHSKGTKK